MTIQRRDRRTDLRKDALDIDELFSNPTLDADGKIITGTASDLTDLIDTTASTLAANDFVKYDGTDWVNTTVASTDLTDESTLARVDSPTFTGTPTSPTPTAGDDSTKIATTEFVQDAVAASNLPTLNTDQIFVGDATNQTVATDLSSVNLSSLNNDLGLATVATSGNYSDLSNTPSSATETTEGLIRIATSAEATTGTDDTTAMTPLTTQERISAALVGGVKYKTTFNATAGTPSLANAAKGDLYIIDTAGTIYGQDWNVGDHLLINENMGGSITNSKIDKVDNTDAVASVNSQTGVVNLTATDVGALASGDNISELTNDSGYITSAPVSSVNTQTGAVVLTAANVGALASGDNISELVNDAGYISSVSSATETTAGIIETATNSEAAAGSAIDKALVPSNVSFLSIASTQVTGLSTVATTGAYSDISGTPTLATVATTGAYSDLSGTPTLGTAASSDTSDFLAATAGLDDLSDVSFTASATIDGYSLIYNHSNTRWEATEVDTSATTVLLDSTNVTQVSGTNRAEVTVAAGTNYIIDPSVENVNFVTSIVFSLPTSSVADPTTTKIINLSELTIFVRSSQDNRLYDGLGNAAPNQLAGGLGGYSFRYYRGTVNLYQSDISSTNAKWYSYFDYTVSHRDEPEEGDGIVYSATDRAFIDVGQMFGEFLITGDVTDNTLRAGRKYVTAHDESTEHTINFPNSFNDDDLCTALDGKTLYIENRGQARIALSVNRTNTPNSGYWNYFSNLDGSGVTFSTQYIYPGELFAFEVERSTNQMYYRYIRQGFTPNRVTEVDNSGTATTVSVGTEHHKVIYVENGANAVTMTVPDSADLRDGYMLSLKAIGTGTVTVSRSGTNTFDAETSIDLAQYEQITLVKNSTGWTILTSDVGGGTEVSSDTTPVLGGDLDVGSFDIISSSNGDIEVAPDGSGKLIVKGNATGGSGSITLNCEANSHGVTIKSPPHASNATYTLTLPDDAGTVNQVLETDGSGGLNWVDQTGGTVQNIKRVNTNYSVSTTDIQNNVRILYTGTASPWVVTLPDPSTLLSTDSVEGGQSAASADHVQLFVARDRAGDINFTNSWSGVGVINDGTTNLSGNKTTRGGEWVTCVAFKVSGTSLFNWLVEDTFSKKWLYVSTTSTAYLEADTYFECNGTFTMNARASRFLDGEITLVKNVGSGTITIDGYSTDTVDGQASITLAPDEWVELMVEPNTSPANFVIFNRSLDSDKLIAKRTGTNYTALATDSITTHLAGIDTALGNVGGGATDLDGLSDVTITTPSLAQILRHNGAGQFVNTDLAIVDDTSPQLGGALNVNGNSITSASNGNVTLDPDGTGDIVVGADVLPAADATHTIGDENTRFISAYTDVNGALRFKAKNDSGGTINKGQAVYIKGVSGTVPTVGLAQANSATTMPAFGLALASANDQSELQIITFGNLTDYNTTTYSLAANNTVYVSASNPGALTNTPPAGELNLIQNIGRVVRADASAGIIKVGGAGRSNATPNLDDGKIFLGNASNQAVSTALSAINVSALNDDGTYLNDLVDDSTPQLGGDLDTAGNYLVTLSNKDLTVAPNGTGVLLVRGNQTGGNNTGAIKLNCEQNSHGVVIRSPLHASAASYTLTLPVDDGTVGQVLRTDGSGNLSWVDQAASGGGFTLSNITSNTTAQISYHYSCNTSANPITLTLPAITAASSGKEIRVKLLQKGTSNNLSIAPDAGGDTVEGSTSSYVLSTDFSSITLVANNGTGDWEVI